MSAFQNSIRVERETGTGFSNLRVAGLLECSRKPFETFIKTVTGSGTSGLDELRRFVRVFVRQT